MEGFQVGWVMRRRLKEPNYKPDVAEVELREDIAISCDDYADRAE